LLSSAYYEHIFDMIRLQLRARDELLGITDGVRFFVFDYGFVVSSRHTIIVQVAGSESERW
jgi:hypothetical protein